MSTYEEDSDHDACPNCGARVESAISAPGEPLREAMERRCPNCGKALRRDIGGEWTVDEQSATEAARLKDAERIPTEPTSVEGWEDEGGAHH